MLVAALLLAWQDRAGSLPSSEGYAGTRLQRRIRRSAAGAALMLKLKLPIGREKTPHEHK